MSMSLVEREGLSQANEDYTGLWELAWTLNSFYPRKKPQEKLRLARVAMKSLLTKGYVRILTTIDEQDSALTVTEATALLESDEAWLPPNEGPGYWFLTTKEGETAYLESDEMCLMFDETVDFLKQCEADDLGVYGVSVYRRKNGRLQKPEIEGRLFKQREGEKWTDLRKRCNAEALEFINTFSGRNDLVFFVSITSLRGPDLIWEAQGW